jgi:hypothetical protein
MFFCLSVFCGVLGKQALEYIGATLGKIIMLEYKSFCEVHSEKQTTIYKKRSLSNVSTTYSTNKV